jgi:FAD/FMN-containing dehydrogenase
MGWTRALQSAEPITEDRAMEATAASAANGLNAALEGRVVLGGAADYDEARRVFNTRVDKRPAVIAQCASTSDVAAAVRFAREHDLTLAARCGGHSTGGFSSVDDGLVIDLRPMNAVEVDPRERTVTAQGGTLWAELDATTQDHGLAVTGGRVSNTGVGGLTVGSGSGWLERKFGLTCDLLTGAEVVTADGEVVRASEDENADLFWAIRGGGSNFGIVTEFDFRAEPLGPMVMAGMLLHPRDVAPELIAFYRDLMADAPDELGGGVALIHGPPEPFVPDEWQLKPVTGIIVLWMGSPADAEEGVRPLKEFGDPIVDLVQPMPYTAVQQLLDAPASIPGLREYFRIDYFNELPSEAIDAFVGHTAKVASPMTQVVLEPLGGVESRVDDHATPLPRPDAPFAFHGLSLWLDPADDEKNMAWARELGELVSPWTLDRALPNFVAEDDSDARLRASYGEENYRRLVQAKDAWDPENVFRVNKNIPPSGGGNGAAA